MYNELLHIGPVTVYGYGLMIGIGIISAYLFAEWLAKKKGLDPELILGLVISCVVCGFAGSKLLYFITVLDEIIADPSRLKALSSGWVVFGGIIGGMLGALLYCKIKKINVLAYMDTGFPAVALAQGFGRIGCFLAGCCYGMEADTPISITFRNSSFAPNNVPLIPTQILSSVGDFIIFFALLAIGKKFKKDGQVAFAYLVLYSVGRFIIEFFRGDLARGSVGALSTSQFISVFAFIAGIAGFIILEKKGKTFVPSEDTDGEEEKEAAAK